MNNDIYYILCERLSPEGIKTVKQLHVFTALEADTIAAEYISNGWHVTIDVEKAYNDNALSHSARERDAPIADVINLFDKAKQRKQFKEAADILGEATARNIANKKRIEAERHRNNNKVLKAYDINNKGGKK